MTEFDRQAYLARLQTRIDRTNMTIARTRRATQNEQAVCVKSPELIEKTHEALPR